MRKEFIICFIVVLFDGVFAIGQDNNLPGIIPSMFYRGRITNRFDYNFFASATFIPIESTVDEREYSGPEFRGLYATKSCL